MTRITYFPPISSNIKVDTKPNILASTGKTGQLKYASDVEKLYIYDGSQWLESPIIFVANNTSPDMGVVDGVELTNDRTGYYDDVVVDKRLSQVRIGGNEQTNNGGIRVSNNVYQVYLNSQWNDVVVNFVFREDSTGRYELEHQPIGFTEYIEIMNGNGNILDPNGIPVIQQYQASMGVYADLVEVDGGTLS